MKILLKESLCKSLTTEIVDTLKEVKMTSVADIISTDLSKLQSISRVKGIDFKTLQNIKKELYDIYGPITVNAFQMNKLVQKCHRFNTGIKKLDEMLVSGIREGQLLEVFGEPNSGKTNFCYRVMANILKSCPKKALFVDTSLSFSIQRLSQILATGFNMDKEEQKELLSRLIIIKGFDLSTVLNIFDAIHHELNTDPDSKYKDLCLIIVDSVSGPLLHEQIGNTFEIEQEMKNRNLSSRISALKYRSISAVSQMGCSLKNFIRNRYIAMIATNSVSIAQNNNWSIHCDISLKISINYEVVQEQTVTEEKIYPYRTIEVVKAFRKNPQNSIFKEFVINQKGLH